MGPYEDLELDAEYAGDVDEESDAPDAAQPLEVLRERILAGPFVSPEARRLFGGV